VSRLTWRHEAILHLNPGAAPPDAPYDAGKQEILSLAAFAEAEAEIGSWPGYEPTPCVALAGLARELGLGGVWIKEEGRRFGLRAFKALGGAYAVLKLLKGEVLRRKGVAATGAELRDGAHRDVTSSITVTTATDGNHGRSVAWGAELFGAKAVIFVPHHCSEARKAGIAAYGAQVVQTDVGFDETVKLCDVAARAEGRFMVADTAWAGYDRIPRWVMQGYALIAEEALRQAGPPTHLFIQAGVGGLAVALTAHFWERLGRERPAVTVVEPRGAACLYESARAGRIVQVAAHTAMSCLDAGDPSPLAWPILQEGAKAFALVEDDVIADAMTLLARSPFGDPPVVAGNSAIAGLAALLSTARDPAQRQALGLGPQSRVLLVASEGDADRDSYRAIVGLSAEEVWAGRAG